MPFEKGHNLAKGRPKGSQNKETKEIRQWINRFLHKSMDQFEADVNSLTPKDRTKVITDLMEYSVPKLQRTELTDGEGNGLKLVIVKDDK